MRLHPEDLPVKGRANRARPTRVAAGHYPPSPFAYSPKTTRAVPAHIRPMDSGTPIRPLRLSSN